MIEDEIIEISKGNTIYDARHCTHLESQDKVLLEKSNIIVLFEIRNDKWIIKRGYENYKRVA